MTILFRTQTTQAESLIRVPLLRVGQVDSLAELLAVKGQAVANVRPVLRQHIRVIVTLLWTTTLLLPLRSEELHTLPSLLTVQVKPRAEVIVNTRPLLLLVAVLFFRSLALLGSATLLIQLIETGPVLLQALVEPLSVLLTVQVEPLAGVLNTLGRLRIRISLGRTTTVLIQPVEPLSVLLEARVELLASLLPLQVVPGALVIQRGRLRIRIALFRAAALLVQTVEPLPILLEARIELLTGLLPLEVVPLTVILNGLGLGLSITLVWSATLLVQTVEPLSVLLEARIELLASLLPLQIVPGALVIQRGRLRIRITLFGATAIFIQLVEAGTILLQTLVESLAGLFAVEVQSLAVLLNSGRGLSLPFLGTAVELIKPSAVLLEALVEPLTGLLPIEIQSLALIVELRLSIPLLRAAVELIKTGTILLETLVESLTGLFPIEVQPLTLVVELGLGIPLLRATVELIKTGTVLLETLVESLTGLLPIQIQPLALVVELGLSIPFLRATVQLVKPGAILLQALVETLAGLLPVKVQSLTLIIELRFGIPFLRATIELVEPRTVLLETLVEPLPGLLAVKVEPLTSVVNLGSRGSVPTHEVRTKLSIGHRGGVGNGTNGQKGHNHLDGQHTDDKSDNLRRNDLRELKMVVRKTRLSYNVLIHQVHSYIPPTKSPRLALLHSVPRPGDQQSKL
ncbi:hypothetical protein HDK90DRAFT_56864 [Phyllosticta capitalensis]|uniref:Uncharacterized protein n=1 Tax=Phyllosticta capitalensis TaxID=121624 RepID=A0ABR1YF31_9PEZI